MPHHDAEPALSPPLAALGGWPDAAWFNAAILSDEEIVGFSFPKIAGTRKQSFHVIERTAQAARPTAKTRPVPAEIPRRLGGKLAILFDTYGATRAIACCRSKILFESAPILFFAELPIARLKPRPAAKLRRELVAIGARGCVVQLQPASAILMFWPAAEPDITAFAEAAQPDHRLHIDFDKADMPVPAKARPAKPVKAADPGSRDAVRDKLLKEVVSLRQQVEALKRAQSELGAMETLGIDDAKLKAMLKLLHPDKHGGSEAANEAATWLNNLRDKLRRSVT